VDVASRLAEIFGDIEAPRMSMAGAGSDTRTKLVHLHQSTQFHLSQPSPLYFSTLPPLNPRRRRLIRRTPTRRIRARPNHRLARHIRKRRTRHHTAHNPRAPGYMRRHTTRRTYTY
jgi:hypothetical protein